MMRILLPCLCLFLIACQYTATDVHPSIGQVRVNVAPQTKQRSVKLNFETVAIYPIGGDIILETIREGNEIRIILKSIEFPDPNKFFIQQAKAATASVELDNLNINFRDYDLYVFNGDLKSEAKIHSTSQVVFTKLSGLEVEGR